jgi:hypothetical protein
MTLVPRPNLRRKRTRYVACDVCSQEFMHPEEAKHDGLADIGIVRWDYQQKCRIVLCHECCAMDGITETFAG